MDIEIEMSIAGLGMIAYSPFAVRHIAEGADYLSSHFWEPEVVAEHVMACEITAFGTGSPGDYHVRLFDGDYPEDKVQNAMAAVRLGIEIRDQTICFRDLYDLMDWTAECPTSQMVHLPDGFYELTVFTSRPASGVVGDNQRIDIHLDAVPEKPMLKWTGVPDISGDDEAE